MENIGYLNSYFAEFQKYHGEILAKVLRWSENPDGLRRPSAAVFLSLENACGTMISERNRLAALPGGPSERDLMDFDTESYFQILQMEDACLREAY